MFNPSTLWKLGMGGFLAICVAAAHGQNAEFSQPPSLTADVRPVEQLVPVLVEAVDLEAVQLKDEIRAQQDLPPRFAMVNPVLITPDSDGIWETLADGSRLWRLRITSPGALSLNLGFTKYAMPPGGRLHVYAADGTQTIRPFTAKDNAIHGELWTPVVLSDEIVVELAVPAEEEASVKLELSAINVGYRGFGETAAPRSGACHVDVACPEGDPWRDEIPSVGVISTGGSLFCTGVMMNNTAQDQTPYFFTAAHCGINSSSDASLVVYWNYENSTCRPPGSGASGGPGDGSLSQFQTGSFFRAGYSVSDFTLVELDSAPNPAWGVTFAGWNRGSGNVTSAVGIHHPNTDEKRISFENQATAVTSYGGTSSPGDGTHVRLIDWDLGVTEPGSSGSPLFDQNHRVIGQLHGGGSACGNNASDWYGRFLTSWTGGGSSSSRLSNWLDPGGTGAVTLDTFVPGGGGGPDNDDCADATPVGNGSFNYSSAGATTDGPDEPGACNFFDYTQVGSDVWFRYTATCNGTATASLCGSAYDTKMAVYGAACPASASAIACNDDNTAACGASSLQSEVTFTVSAGNSYLIRVGGYNGASGSGTLTLSCSGTGPVCGNGVVESGEDCDDGNGSNTDACLNTCDDASCGDGFVWSGVEECDDGNTSPGDGCDANCQIESGGGVGNCCETGHGAGCSVPSIESCVCAQDSFCCNTNWDSQCVAEVESFGCASCSGGDNDECANALPIGDGATPFDSTGNTTDGPDEPGACNFFSYTQVGADEWFRYTATCNGTATASLCGSAYDTKMAVYGASCPASGAAIACNDDFCGDPQRQSEVTFSVTAGQSYLVRVGGYNAATGAGTLTMSCSPSGPVCGNGVVETGEDCDDGNTSNTDACLNSCVDASCGDGFVWSGVEECDDANGSNTDACLNSCDAASCGDGFVWSGVEECDDGNASNTDACLNSCDAASCGDGFVWSGVEECDDGNASNTDACLNSCDAASCGDGFVWGGVEECDDGNTSPGDGCDGACMTESTTNDACADADPVGEGVTPFDTTAATTDGPALPAECDEGFGLAFGQDIWYCYTAGCSGSVTASLCGSGYDTRMSVYDGCACPATNDRLVACNDDFCGDPARQSEVTFAATAGQSFLIRVGGYNTATGTGTLTIDCSGCTGPGDCDDGTFCNGAEQCVAGLCQSGSDPCTAGEWCDESGNACVPYGTGDFNRDLKVDLYDFAFFQICFGQMGTGACEDANMNGDGQVDIDDYISFEEALTGP